MLKLKIVWFLVVGLLLVGCGSTAPNRTEETSKNVQVKNNITSNSTAPNPSSDSSTKNSESKSDDQTKNAANDKQTSMQKLNSSIQTWTVDKNNFRTDFNSFSPDVKILESGNTLKTIDNLQKLETDYNTLQTDYNLLVKDTSNITVVLEKYPELKQDPNVKDLVLGIGKAVDDVGTINKIIKTDIDNVIQIANKFNSGSLKDSDISLPHSSELTTFISDFKTQNLKIEQCLLKIK